MNNNENQVNEAAAALGRMGKGRKKALSAEERERRRQVMVALNEKRRAAKESEVQS